ncbi:EscR/YscR/HrcR family type III secretion system export apparatus protein [Proteus mirabilis]|uniref:EscR/YscR/HrcR family type III secretion system export apparatus protein n=1 Tax=Proteus mirabilis TaxID=584 RepID=UPI00234B34B1|nr:EscR/YscR/HrcR family type III secretion system export apparatus protein [Proteus mirabilis]MDC5886295.1 EscR/YscR/HrcR family type III secretion system export apparatus protein [Proteus mirabilis]MDC5903892.1 EscR/YscR/HrcR family type III secretion system export apparatus protein [Proteus mirabilis]MDC5907442.1 EscR/YscR/HrcR family type III secretion system export apparatus protein [Proteus mirabilis]MDC5921549.1 EscR/YscR/HrcR family type III secretion system export apparatus protein [Pr
MIDPTSTIVILVLATLLPFIIAAGTCYLKFSIVFVMVRNALGVQQVPSNMVLNAIALVMALFVMTPVIKNVYEYSVQNPIEFSDPESLDNFIDGSLGGYKHYLQKYSDPELLAFFEEIQGKGSEFNGDTATTVSLENEGDADSKSLFSLLPAYALSEIKAAFIIGFYLYLPFVVIDLVVSSILLALGMMMMSPITLSVPIKLILFVALDGWTLLSKGLVLQYIDLAGA